MTIEQIERRLRMLELSRCGSDYVRARDDEDQATKDASDKAAYDKQRAEDERASHSA